MTRNDRKVLEGLVEHIDDLLKFRIAEGKDCRNWMLRLSALRRLLAEYDRDRKRDALWRKNDHRVFLNQNRRINKLELALGRAEETIEKMKRGMTRKRVPHICRTCASRGRCPVTETKEPCWSWRPKKARVK